MQRTTIRRGAAVLAATAALGIATATASAANTMPANNPSDFATLVDSGQAAEFNVQLAGSKLGDQPFQQSVNNGLMGGVGATITVSRARVNNMSMLQTVTIRPTKTGQVTSTITNAFATLSGGNYGSGVIRSTRLNPNGKSYVIQLWFDEQGTQPNLNLKFFLYHS